MKLKLLKLSQILQDLNNPEEARLVKDFVNQPEPEERVNIEYPEDEDPNIFRDKNKPKLIKDYPAETEDLDVTSEKYYRDLAIQAYLDLFYSGAKLSDELGSGSFSDTFLAIKDGKKIAVKFSKFPEEYTNYLSVKNKRDSLPQELKLVLPEVYEAKEISKADASKVNGRVKATEGSFFKASEHFIYKSFIAMELLIPTDTKIKDLMYEPDFLNALIKNEEDLLVDVKALLEKWISEWDWDSYSKLAGNNSNAILIKKIVDEKENLNIIATDICLRIFELKNSDEDIWLNDDSRVSERSYGGTLINTVAKFFVNEAISNILEFSQMRLSPRSIDRFERVKKNLSILITEPSLEIKKLFAKIVSFYSATFPRYPGEILKDVKMERFLEKLKSLETHGIRWGDTHGENLMLRPTSGAHGYGDLVVADLGLFKFT